MSKRLNQDREKKLEPKRLIHAKKVIAEAGFKIEKQTDKSLTFRFKGREIVFWPYSGWFSGKPVKDGRGLKNLMRQIQGINHE